MAHTYVSGLVHCVFSTKHRRNLIETEIQSHLWSFMGGIARKNKCKALIIGGTENHVHILLSLSADMALAKAMQLIKGASSRWMNENHTKDFGWQEGYGASKSDHNCIHRVAGGTSSQTKLRRRIHRVLEETQRRIRFAIHMGIAS